MRSRTAAALLCAALVVGCSSVTDLDGYDPRGTKLPAADFSVWSPQSGTEPIPPLTVVGGIGAISAGGTVVTADPCYDFMAFAQIHGAEIRLDIVGARARGILCITVPGLFGYNATIRDLSPGAYVVRITHIISGRAEPVLTETVVIR